MRGVTYSNSHHAKKRPCIAEGVWRTKFLKALLHLLLHLDKKFFMSLPGNVSNYRRLSLATNTDT